VIRRALPLLLLCATAAAAQPGAAPVHEEVRRQVEIQFGDRLRDLEIKSTVAITLLGINLFGIVPAYLYLLHRARKIAEKEIAKAAHSRHLDLAMMLDERDDDRRLRRETSILVIAARAGTEGILRQTGFADVLTILPETLEARKIEPASIVVFDLDNGCSEELAASLIETRALESVLVYTSKRSNLSAPGLTYANSAVTLFSRLMELIRFRKALAPKRS